MSGWFDDFEKWRQEASKVIDGVNRLDILNLDTMCEEQERSDAIVEGEETNCRDLEVVHFSEKTCDNASSTQAAARQETDVRH